MLFGPRAINRLALSAGVIGEIAEYLRRKTGICFKSETLKNKIEAYVKSGELSFEEVEPGVYRKAG